MKLRDIKYRPGTVFLMYIGVIIFCAALYYYFPSMLSDRSMDIITSLYFSVITITTVGYGDIRPVSNFGKVITGGEAFIGIIIIGLFLNSLWQSYTQRISEKQELLLRKQQKERSLNRIRIYHTFLRTIFSSFKLSIAELTTPLANRHDSKFAINPNFKFSDLKSMYMFSLILVRGFKKTVLELYFENEAELIRELKYFLANFDIYEFPKLHQSIVQFLALSKELESREALLSYLTMQVGTRTMAKMAEEMIQGHEECPDLGKHSSGILTPVILLYQSLKRQIELINVIEEEFSEIVK